MSLSERSRSALYLGLGQIVNDEKAVEEMLSYFPARDVEESVTKEFLRAEMAVQRAEVQAEFAAVRLDMAGEFASVRSDMAGEFASVRSEMSQGFASVRSEFASVRSESGEGLASVRGELRAGLRRQMVWMISTMFTFNGLMVALVAMLR